MEVGTRDEPSDLQAHQENLKGSHALPAAIDGPVENKRSVQSLGERPVCKVRIKDKFILLTIDM